MDIMKEARFHRHETQNKKAERFFSDQARDIVGQLKNIIEEKKQELPVIADYIQRYLNRIVKLEVPFDEIEESMSQLKHSIGEIEQLNTYLKRIKTELEESEEANAEEMEIIRDALKRDMENAKEQIEKYSK